MSASLVGSEMCIRDSPRGVRVAHLAPQQQHQRMGGQGRGHALVERARDVVHEVFKAEVRHREEARRKPQQARGALPEEDDRARVGA
eukprot:14766880-Alexandrium_andersonii.AAC.1